MKKKTSRKKVAKPKNSYSENFIMRLRHSRKSQMASMMVLAIGLAGIYLVIASLIPANYGENTGRLTIERRGDSFRERIGLRISSAFNRLNFAVSRDKDKPEWITPIHLPAPPDNVKSSLPDTTIFGDAESQFITSLPEAVRESVSAKSLTTLAPEQSSNGSASVSTAQNNQSNPEELNYDPSGDSYEFYKGSDEFCYYVNENAY